ncbi:hypothetical protein MKX01_013601 [Papaver californicum]|nr:hypothetical protein MKX01_013601 [Papaver californicum]
MVMSGSSMATYFMVSLILLISAFIIAMTVSDQQQQQQTRPIVLHGSSSTLNIFKKEASSSEQEFENIIEALMVLSITDPFTFPITATFLIPSDDPLISTTSTSSFTSSSSCCSRSLSSTIGYHIIPQQLSFSVLQTFAIGSRIPTLLHEKTVLATNNSKSNYTIDEIQIAYPDLYMNGAVVVHVIKKILNYTFFGCEDSVEASGISNLVLDEQLLNTSDNEKPRVNDSSSMGCMRWVLAILGILGALLLGYTFFRICCLQGPQQGIGQHVNQELWRSWKSSTT